MEYDGERTYSESDWAVRRWDWFHDPYRAHRPLTEPLSFCQFWRTVLLWATIRWLASPLLWLDRVTTGRTLPSLPLPSIPWRHTLLPVKGCWFALCLGARGLWRLTYPLRCAARPVGGAALAGAVGLGERIEASYQPHKTGIERVLTALLILMLGGVVALLVLAAFSESWLWTLIVIGAIAAGVVVGFAAYGFSKSGAGALLWEAAVVVHHGICPPVRIVR